MKSDTNITRLRLVDDLGAAMLIGELVGASKVSIEVGHFTLTVGEERHRIAYRDARLVTCTWYACRSRNKAALLRALQLAAQPAP